MTGKLVSEKSNDTVEQMFSRVASRYDFLNHFLSFGIDKLWRKKFMRISIKDQPKNILDVATGTGAMLFEFHKNGVSLLTGIDPSTGMLKQAKVKLEKANIKAELNEGFCEELPYQDNQFDLVTVVFGIRNFKNLHQSFTEIHRVLKPGGKVRILEFSMPKNVIIKTLYRCYLRCFIPVWGRIISGDKMTYRYLSKSIKAFSKRIEVNNALVNTGFLAETKIPLSMGIASIYTGIKNK